MIISIRTIHVIERSPAPSATGSGSRFAVAALGGGTRCSRRAAISSVATDGGTEGGGLALEVGAALVRPPHELDRPGVGNLSVAGGKAIYPDSSEP